MGYRQFIFSIYSDELLALLSAFEFEAFEEMDDELAGYIEDRYCTPAFYSDLKILMDTRRASYTEEELEPINWNAAWESGFKPVIVGDFCIVRASFHTDLYETQHDIIIDPKMAFGTGHHETTYMMIEWLHELSFHNKHVLDHGSGTGVLAILAEKCNAARVDALDIEEDAYHNTQENIITNNCSRINPVLGAIDQVSDKTYHIILANINRNVLINTCQEHLLLLKKSGKLIMSGILNEDEAMVKSCYQDAGFKFIRSKYKGQWVSLLFTR